MLRYSKTLSLALLFSLPAFAMEEQVSGPLTQEEAVAEATDLTRTLLYTGTYEEHSAKLADLVQKKLILEQEEEQAREERNKALDGLLAKKQAKEQAVSGIKTALQTIKDQLDALNKEKEEKAAAITAEIEAKAAKLKEEEAKVLADQKQHEEALAKISAVIEAAGNKAAAQTEAPKKTGRWWLFGY